MVQLLSNNAIRKRPVYTASETHPERIDIFARIPASLYPFGSIFSISTLEQSAGIILSRIADAFQKWLFVVTRNAVNAHEAPGAKHRIKSRWESERVRELSTRCPVNSTSPSEKSLARAPLFLGTSRRFFGTSKQF